MTTRRHRKPLIPDDLRPVLKRLSRYRGEFEIGEDGEIRHRSVFTPVFPAIQACPLAFLCLEECEYIANTSVNDFANTLDISVDSAIAFMQAADDDQHVPAHSKTQVAALRRAIIQACV